MYNKSVVFAVVALATLPVMADMNLEENMYAPAREMMAMDEAMNKAIEQKRQENLANPIVFEDDISFHEAPIAEFVDYNSSYVLEKTIEDANNTKVSVSLANNVLTISSEISKEEKSSTNNSSLSSSYTSTTMETLSIPLDADTEKMEKSYENGLLKVLLPKKGN